jgi:hypothetical protein
MVAAGAPLFAADERPKAPFRVLYSNDTTNIVTTPSPGYVRKDPFSLQRLATSVDEAAGVDVHLLQPGNGWVPWWKSSIYPADAHYRWFQENTGLPAGTIGELMLQGGDLVGAFVKHCRTRNIAPFISIRLNDYHGTRAEILDQPTAALLRDLKQRGQLDKTLVVWCTEFGRMPFMQANGTGRDHNIEGFTCWLMGAGVKPGISIGSTDELGWKAAESVATLYDFNATILHLLGLDHERLTHYFNGTERRLTDVHGHVIKEVLS